MLRCNYCGGKHLVDYCPHTFNGSVNLRSLRCSYCGSESHNREGCPAAWPKNPDEAVTVENPFDVVRVIQAMERTLK